MPLFFSDRPPKAMNSSVFSVTTLHEVARAITWSGVAAMTCGNSTPDAP
jgi:hypothetical protein